MEPLINTKQVAELLGIEPASLEVARGRRQGLGHDIPYLKLSNTAVRYRPEDVRAWLDRKEVKV